MGFDQNFKNLVNRYHPIDWLTKSIERSRNVDRTQLDKRENIYANTEFLVIMSDIALRISNNDKLVGRIPTDQEYMDFINLYINTQQDKIQSKLLREYGLLALSLMTAEQIKFKYPHNNLLGRLFLLYSHYEKEIIEATGLNILSIITILLTIMVYYDNDKHYAFEAKHITLETIDALKSENISSFLDYFAIDVRGYRKALKDLGFDKHQLYSFRLLERYPIIKFSNDKYIVPSFDNLLYSITNNMNIHLLAYLSEKDKGKAYHDSLGVKFEDYVRLLTGKVFDDITKAKDLVPKNTENAEFVINHNNTAIVVEVKKFIFRRDTAFKNNIDDLKELLDRHIKKAFRQIETTFKHVKQEKKIGIIVIFGDVNVQTAIHDYLRTTYPDEGVAFLDNIIITSIGAYESLLANSKEEIMETLNSYLQTNKNQKGDILLTIHSLEKETINPYLKNIYLDSLKRFGLDA